MAIIYTHSGGGCEAITKEVGNELSDVEIHRFLCSQAAIREIIFSGGFSKKVCQVHADRLITCWNTEGAILANHLITGEINDSPNLVQESPA